ncbi:MAG: hypothetical protein KDC98_21260 [Planctomycetes bacterium]|nr:hypothetical protein [Planctomycetota bacterium]
MNRIDHIDARLVAFLHGELEGEERSAIVARLRTDADARARLALLESTDLALTEALDRHAAPAAARPFATILRPLLALAAILIVIAIFAFDGRIANDPAVAGNDHFELRVAAKGGGSAPLFCDAALQLFWKNLDQGDPKLPIAVYPFPFGMSRAEVAARVDRETHVGSRRMQRLPVIVTASIHGPEGLELQARLAPRGETEPFLVDATTATQLVLLRDFEVELETPRPAFIGNPGEREWLDDGRWIYANMPSGESARLFPEVPGEWRIELSVECLPAPAFAPWPTFAEPQLASTAIVMTGEMTEWSEDHHGMRARLVWASGAVSTDTTPFALQLRNESGHDRKYNHVGTTIAKIPQPMHFTLLVDGEEWQQNDRVPVFIAAGDLGRPHPTGTFRTIVTRPGHWHRAGATLGTKPGRHQVQVLFHFEPSFWGNDPTLWMGKLLTPRLAIDVPPVK